MSKLIQVYASDRVGKSTFCQKYRDGGYEYHHFSRSDYSSLLTTDANYVVADRGYLEQYFYDTLYRGVHYTQEQMCSGIKQFERQLAAKYHQVETFWLYKPWDDIMIQRHLDELSEMFTGSPLFSQDSIEAQLTKRKDEHIKYYQYMNQVRKLSMFTHTIITTK